MLGLPRDRCTGQRVSFVRERRVELTVGEEETFRSSRKQSPFGLHHLSPRGAAHGSSGKDRRSHDPC
jgi:hypothetical protein